jgi:hypothetical protein
MEHETIRGRLLYTSKKPQILDKVRGGETFTITKHVGGRRTLRAHCAIDENSPRVLRDSITNMDADWRPLGGFVQITVDEAFVGSAWYRFSDRLAECEGETVSEGRFSKRLELASPPAFFGTHPIQADALHTHCYDLSRGPGVQTVPSYLMCSVHHRGADGPTLIERHGIVLAYLGTETVTVAAGTFEALHFRIGDNTDDAYMGTDRHPPYHLWVSADGDYILLKAYCTGYMQTYYELVELERRRNFF